MVPRALVRLEVEVVDPSRDFVLAAEYSQLASVHTTAFYITTYTGFQPGGN